MDETTCPICLRPIPEGARASRHHLVPKLKGGARKGTVLVHHICHQAIHARFSEAELARRLATPEAIRTHPAMADFLLWIAGKPPDFHAPTRQTNNHANNRRGRRQSRA